MGRLLCSEKSEPSRKAEDIHSIQSSRTPLMSANIPLQQQNTAAFPPISPVYLRANTVNQRPVSSFADMPPLQERSHSSFQDSFSAQSEIKQVRSSAVSPNLKLPPIFPSKASSAPEVLSLPSQSNASVPPVSHDVGNAKCPSLMDMRLAYENMMVSYFMPQSVKSENSSLPENISTGQIPNQQIQNSRQSAFSPTYASHSLSSVQQLMEPCNNNYMVSQTIIPDQNYAMQENLIPVDSSLTPKNSQTYANPVQIPSTVTQHTSRDVTSSGCTLLDGMSFDDYQQQSLISLQTNKILKSDNGYNPESLPSIPPVQESITNSASSEPQPPLLVHGDQNTNIADMSAVINELSMFIPSQDNDMVDSAFSSSDNIRTFSTSVSTTNVSTCTTALSSSVNYQYHPKSDPTWGRFSVLPPVMSSAAPSGGCISESDNISLMSYNSVPSNAQNNSQMGMYYTSFSPFSVNFSDNLSSAFAPSPRYSGRSSYSGRGTRNKRALSNSPLSAEGIDLNSIIRMSPTSLIAYINGSRSSSSCVSPGSAGERTGCYGHLSARNSSSSPHSGSNSSGNRRSASYTPQTSTPGMSNSRSTQSNTTSDNSNASAICNESSKTEFLDMDDNLLVIQAMQDLESGATISGNAPFPFSNNIIHPSQLIPECENLQVLPQDIAAFRTEDFLPYVPPVLPPVHTHIQPNFQTQSSQSLHNITPHNKPPPTYDQHMARKATLQKNSSSESSQPSNSSSFESSEGDKTVAGNSSTDTESNRMFACRWLDCTAVFQDQDEFVSHIEKVHVDQKKGEDFICYWKLCPRRLHPFNARYKLLVHMRVHSGDKPNKCSYSGCKKAFSRLENLKIHLRSHTGERPYSCTFPGCTKTFSNSSDRTKHQKTHHDTKPYVCQVTGCGKRYTDPSSLRKHVKKSHPDKKEPERKKIRGGVEELDPKDVNECLMIQAIKPITLCDASPPEPTDSGLGRSPRGSQPASSSDHYPGLIYDSLCRTETAQGSSCHTSPSSHHSSPPGPTDRDKIPSNNNSLRVPILPPIVPSPTSQIQNFPNQNQMPSGRPTSKNTAMQRASAGSSLESSPRRNSSVMLQGARNAPEVSASRLSDIYSSTIRKTPDIYG